MHRIAQQCRPQLRTYDTKPHSSCVAVWDAVQITFGMHLCIRTLHALHGLCMGSSPWPSGCATWKGNAEVQLQGPATHTCHNQRAMGERLSSQEIRASCWLPLLMCLPTPEILQGLRMPQGTSMHRLNFANHVHESSMSLLPECSAMVKQT